MLDFILQGYLYVAFGMTIIAAVFFVAAILIWLFERGDSEYWDASNAESVRITFLGLLLAPLWPAFIIYCVYIGIRGLWRMFSHDLNIGRY